MRFSFYERVVVCASERHPHLVGKSGFVLGVSEDEGRTVDYSVFFEELGECLGFRPSELRGTGEIAERSKFYGGESVRVEVKDGRGSIVEDE